MEILMKTIIAGALVTFSAWLAGKKPVLAGFIIALPVMSILTILMSYLQYRDMQKINQFAVSILVAVPLSLAFFIPFVLNKWLKLDFVVTFLAAIGCTLVAFLIHQFIFKSA